MLVATPAQTAAWIYWKRASEQAAVYSMIATAAVGLFWVVYNAIVGHVPIPGLTETYISVITAFVTTVIFSLIFRKPAAVQKLAS